MPRRRNHYGGGGFNRGKITGRRTIGTIEELRELGEHVVAAAKEALREGAEEVVAEAKRRVLVKTGALRDSIKATPKKEGTIYSISADAFKTNRDGRRFYYGQAVEFDPEIDKPFLYPAMDALREDVIKKVEDAVNRAINGV